MNDEATPPSRQELVTERLYDLLYHRAEQSRDHRVYGFSSTETIIWTIHSRFPTDPRPTVHEVVNGLHRLEFTKKIRIVRHARGVWIEVSGVKVA